MNKKTAILPVLFAVLVMGLTADKMGSQAGSLAVIGVCVVYLVICAFFLLNPKKANA